MFNEIAKIISSGDPDSISRVNQILKEDREERIKKEITKSILEDIISTIEKEINRSSTVRYNCTDGTFISTDVGYVEEWFNEYKEVLRRKYCE